MTHDRIDRDTFALTKKKLTLVLGLRDGECCAGRNDRVFSKFKHGSHILIFIRGDRDDVHAGAGPVGCSGNVHVPAAESGGTATDLGVELLRWLIGAGVAAGVCNSARTRRVSGWGGRCRG